MKWQKECPYCGKIYKSKRFYKLHIKKHTEELSPEETRIEGPKKATRKVVNSEVKFREIVYLGTADKATVRGSVTSKKYDFLKDKYKMPKSTKVDERDYPGIVVLKGKGCARRDPTVLYMSKLDWNLELEAAKVSNR